MAKTPKWIVHRPVPDLILRLERLGRPGLVILQPYDMEMGAGTFHPATTLRSLGPKPGARLGSPRAAPGRPLRREPQPAPTYQFRVILKPSPADIGPLSTSLYAIGIDPKNHDIRFVETTGSRDARRLGLGWEVWCDGMEVAQFTYFQQVGGFDCDPSQRLTYRLERLAMYVQRHRVYDLNFNGGEGKDKVTYGDVFLQAEQEYSRFNFEHADTGRLLDHFRDAEAECKALLARRPGGRHLMVLPAYDQAIKASHLQSARCARRSR
jgi:glycyl-tRNA synthetase alpha chain